MDYKNINIDEIKIIPSIKDSYDIEYQGKQIYINSPILYIPFGIEKFYNAYSLNLQIRNCQEFENFIESLEKHLINILKISEDKFTSQLRKNNKHDTILYTKILNKNDKILCDVKSRSGEYLNIFNLGKDIECQVKLFIDKVWFIKGKYTYKLKVKELCV